MIGPTLHLINPEIVSRKVYIIDAVVSNLLTTESTRIEKTDTQRKEKQNHPTPEDPLTAATNVNGSQLLLKDF